jgi:hypothetical protein
MLVASGDSGRESELQSSMNCTRAPSGSDRHLEKDEEERRSTTAATGGSTPVGSEDRVSPVPLNRSGRDQA